MTISTFETSSFHGQITIQKEKMSQFPYWSENHVKQGFSMSDEAISFAIPDHEGSLWVEIDLELENTKVSKEAIISIEAPFRTEQDKAWFVGHDGEYEIDIPQGVYSVRFTLLPGRSVGGNWMTYTLNIQFIASENPAPKILVANEDMDINAEIKTTPAEVSI